jgi:cysteine desulfurase
MLLSDGTLYLDFNATTPLAPEAADALDAASRRVFGNPSSAHAPGREAKALIEDARGSVARLVGCQLEEIIFTSSGTEAAALAWNSALEQSGRRVALLSAVEHPCVQSQREIWESRGISIRDVPVDHRGVLDLPALEEMLTDEVALVSVMAAHNETGVLQPLESVGRMARARGALFHTDAVQAMGKVPSPWATSGADFLSLSGHKVYAPKGIGALAVRKGAPVRPMLLGGGQERGARASTEAVPLAHALGVAARLAMDHMESQGSLAVLRDGLEKALEERYAAVIHGKNAARLPNTSFFTLPGASGPALAAALDARGIFVATGSACHSGGGGLPKVLQAMGCGLGTAIPLRVSLGRKTTGVDVERFLGALDEILRR